MSIKRLVKVELKVEVRDSVHLHYVFISLQISKSIKMLRVSLLIIYSMYLKWRYVIIVISELNMEH